MRLKIACYFYYFVLASCWDKSAATSPPPQHLIREVKTALLPLFGFKDRPKIEGDSKVLVPEALKTLYQKQNDFDLETASLPLPGLHTQSANTVRSFTHVESPIDDRFAKHHRKFRLKFDVRTIPRREKLKAAELQLNIHLDRPLISDSDSHYQRIVVEDIIRRGIKRITPPITRTIDSKRIDLFDNSTVISFDVLPAVERWIDNPKTNHGLLITVLSKKKNSNHLVRPKRDLSEDIYSAKQPLLLTYTDDGKNKQKTGKDMLKLRSRRAMRRGHRKNERDPCRRRQMYVDFRDVGWSDWIVAPLGYDAFYCDGECEYPMAEHMNTTNHAIIQSMMNSVRPTEVPKPCCVPTQLSAISMLYLDSQKQVILKNYKEMVVTGCGCR